METVQLKNVNNQSHGMIEALRALRTNLQFCGDDVKTILFTSYSQNEGKSTVVMDLARSMTDSKKSVLVIDGDIRKSVMVGRLAAQRERGREIYGLSHYLSGQKTMADVVFATDIPRLYMVFAGPSVPNSTELLEKNYFEKLVAFAREHFDYVLIDCPPLGATIDAAVIAKQCDGAVIVVAQGQTKSRMVADVKRQLEISGVRILGAVLNKVKAKRNGYYGKYYGKYYGTYYGNYGEEDGE